MMRRRIAQTPSREGLARYVDMLIDAVSRECGSLEGKAILEIGPGDNIATGLTFLALGAKTYTALDRFPGGYLNLEARTWYALLPEHLGRHVPEPDDPRIRLIGTAVECAGDIGQFDIICSNAVGEHVSSVPAFARLNHAALAPGGTALHIVDFSGHHWHRNDDPELFRRFPNWLWHAMGSNRGLPNRVSYSAFVTAFDAAGLKVSGTYERSVAVIVASHH